MSETQRPLLAKPAYILPAMGLLLAFFIVPVLVTVAIGFTDWKIGGPLPHFIGLDNYADLLGSAEFRNSLANTLELTALVIPASFVLALLLALGVRAAGRLAGLWQTIYFLPVASTLVAMSVVWQWLLHPELGLVAWALQRFGLDGINWLNDPQLVLFTIGLISVWQLAGYYMVLFLAGLMQVPRVLYEAAEIDGAATAFDRFAHVTWPMLGPTALFVLIITVIKSFQIFDVVKVLTNGGPDRASEIILYTLYQEGFAFFRTGLAAAIATIFFVFMLAFSLYQMRVFERRVFYG
ncbi:MAG: carbohydrate ABC transporter permease [Rhodospirillaceae bacterium]